MAPASTFALDALDLCRLARLKAEWEAAQARTDLARERFEREVEACARRAGVTGPFDLDLDRGQMIPAGTKGATDAT